MDSWQTLSVEVTAGGALTSREERGSRRVPKTAVKPGGYFKTMSLLPSVPRLLKTLLVSLCRDSPSCVVVDVVL
ncbi:hypothetical protein J6590_022234 [Homalodisca vitripennis]|nr:hypothetical protein J6590_022234 [Homalodisca vitripennis]